MEKIKSDKPDEKRRRWPSFKQLADAARIADFCVKLWRWWQEADLPDL